jgi:hypothetical protein
MFFLQNKMAKLAVGAISANQLQFSLNPPASSSHFMGKFQPPQPIIIDKFKSSDLLPAMVSFLLSKLTNLDDSHYCQFARLYP